MKFLFVGNRRFVLEELIKSDSCISNVLVLKNSYLEKDITKIDIDFSIINSKKELINKIETTDFDILISNGCPYILPISKLRKKIYVNIHPSYLPDLKGIDPCIGAILHNRDAGATCHLMNDKIDSGDIISRVKIPFSKDLDISLLYQLSFLAEKKVFNMALKRSFKPIISQDASNEYLYYNRNPEDRIISFNETNSGILSKIKAFNNKSQGCIFSINNNKFLAYEALILKNKFLLKISKPFENRTILFVYEDAIVFKKDNEIIKFFKVVGDFTKIKQGDRL